MCFWGGAEIPEQVILEFIRHLKRNTQFKYEIEDIIKTQPSLTVIPENAFKIFFTSFIEGHEERKAAEANKVHLNQEILFSMQ